MAMAPRGLLACVPALLASASAPTRASAIRCAVISRGRAAGRIEFSEYGADFRITAPEEPLDVGKLPVRG